LQVPVFRWFNRHLKQETGPVDRITETRFEPEPLKVFETVPEDERSSRIHETFVPKASTPSVPRDSQEWNGMRSQWLRQLRNQCFGGWPEEGQRLNLHRLVAVQRHGLRFEIYTFDSQESVPLRLYCITPTKVPVLNQAKVMILGDGIKSWNYAPGGAENVAGLEVDIGEEGLPVYTQWLSMMLGGFDAELEQERQRQTALTGELEVDEAAFKAWVSEVRAGQSQRIFVVPRGVGMSSWSSEVRKQIQIRRRFMLVGQTLESMRVWDIRQAWRAVRSLHGSQPREILLEARGDQACNLLYASLFELGNYRMHLQALPPSHRVGPDYLNVLKILDIPQALTMAVEQGVVELSQLPTGSWDFPLEILVQLEWPPGQLVLRDKTDGPVTPKSAE
jgi:hypothetical protein